MSGRHMAACTVMAALLASITSIGLAADAAQAEKLDPAVVKVKIESLGLRDDLMQANERPEVWLKERRDVAMPELIAGLSSTESRIAQGCLYVLDGAPESKGLVDALVSVAENPTHPLRVKATWFLAQYADDPRVPPILEASIGDVIGDAPDAKWQLILKVVREKTASGQLTVGHFAELLTSNREDVRIGVMKRLGDLALKAAVPDLESVSKGKHWATAGTAYLALAKIDPEHHGLAAGQEEFLRKVTPQIWTGKGGRVDWSEFARFDRKEIRPFVMRMLESDYREPALEILSMWQDKEALPELMRIAETGTSAWQQTPYFSTCIRIARTSESVKGALAILARYPVPYNDSVARILHDVVSADMPAEDKLTILRAFRDNIDARYAERIPASLGELNADGRSDELPKLLAPLVAEETNLAVLGAYCRVAVADPGKRFGPQVQEALGKAAERLHDPTASVDGAGDILNAAKAYALEGMGPVADGFFAASDPGIRIAAARVSAGSGGDRVGALRVLYEALKNPVADTREAAASAFADVPCADEHERAAREVFALSTLGTQAEDYALRVLATCGGKESIERLLPLLDEESIPRAVHAAWVLTQLPDKSAYDKGLRRLAVAALFSHQATQIGSQIHLDIAPDIYLGMFFGLRGNRDIPPYPNPAGIVIPADLLVPFALDEKEREFATRVYWKDQAVLQGTSLTIPVTNIAREDSWPSSYEGLFRTVAEFDFEVRPLFVQGRPVVDFPTRRAAARIIQSMTGQSKIGPNLAGKNVDLAEPPRAPYENQDALLAAFILDSIQNYLPLPSPTATGVPVFSKEEQRRQAGFESMIERLISDSAFGKSLQDAFIAESKRRGIERSLWQAHFSLWRYASK